MSADAVRNLLGRYCELMDAADWAGLGELFAEATLRSADGTVVAAGAEAIQRFYERGTRLYDGVPGTRHITANSIIEVDGATATARSSFVVFQAAPGLSLQPIIAGRYRDRFASGTDGSDGWHFVERQFFVDQLGDLSHHLTYAIPSS